MKYCKDCVGFDECKTTGRTVEFAVDDGVCIDFDEYKPQTNADRIRAMSDEELAKFLAEIEYRRSGFGCGAKWKDAVHALIWLQQTSEEV